MTDYYIDEEKEWEWQQRRADIEQTQKDINRYNVEKQQEAIAQDQQKIFEDALKEQGLTAEEYQQLAGLDPNFTRDQFIEGVRTLVKNVKTRARDPRTGQFIKQTSGFQPQVAQRQEAQHHRGANDRLEVLKQTAQKRTLTDDEIGEVLDAVVGNLYDV